MLEIEMSLWSLKVNIKTELKYPDQIDDICNRASNLFMTGLVAAKNQGLDLTQVQAIDLGLDEDEG
jgi:hypothetical protein